MPLTAKIKNGKPVIKDELDRVFIVCNGEALVLWVEDIGDDGIKIWLLTIGEYKAKKAGRETDMAPVVLITHDQAGELARFLKGENRSNRRIPEGASQLLRRMEQSRGRFFFRRGDKSTVEKLRIAITWLTKK